MLFHPKHVDALEGRFVFCGPVRAVAHSCLHKAAVLDFWNNFTYGFSTLSATVSGDYRRAGWSKKQIEVLW